MPTSRKPGQPKLALVDDEAEALVAEPEGRLSADVPLSAKVAMQVWCARNRKPYRRWLLEVLAREGIWPPAEGEKVTSAPRQNGSPPPPKATRDGHR